MHFNFGLIFIIPLVLFIIFIIFGVILSKGVKNLGHRAVKGAKSFVEEFKDFTNEMKEKDKKYCEYCGSVVNINDAECKSCGAKISKKK